MKKAKKAQKLTHNAKPVQPRPFISHVHELRSRLFWSVFFIAIFSGVGAVIREQIIDIILRPAADQQFIYTNPAGGFDFNFRIIIYFGIALGTPALIYNLIRFLEPLMRKRSVGYVFKATVFSYVLALAGIAFGYFVGLPAALKFLLHQFTSQQIEALITIQEYMSFVLIYMVGFALLFQIPLILLFINRITPLKPGKLFGYQRFVIAISFAVAAIITPTGDVLNLSLMAGPMILMYQFGVMLILVYNLRHRKRNKFKNLWKQDEENRRLRLEARRQASLVPAEPLPARPKVAAKPPAPTVADPEPAPVTALRYRRPVQRAEPRIMRRQYVDMFVPTRPAA